jgi:uncharacterized RDD family membrane protein YckC
MTENYTEMLKANYENMHTDILIETKIKGGLTEIAEKTLEEELKKRNVSEKEIKEYSDSDSANIKPDDFAEGITLGDLAKTGSRYVAQIVDQIIGFGLSFIVLLLGINAGIALLLSIAIYVSYIMFNDAMPNGQSLGKKLFSIKVVNKTSGKNCSLSESFLRNITTIIPFLAFIDAMMILGRKKQRIGDRFANTIVINA